MLFLKQSLLGWKRFGQRYGGGWVPLPVVLLVGWMVLFILLFPLVWSAGWAAQEYTLMGSVADVYPEKLAFVTLVTGAKYSRGARVLGHTLTMHNERQYPMVALVVDLDEGHQQALVRAGWKVKLVEPIPFFPPDRDETTWKWIPEKRLGSMHVLALTKMRVWEMEEFDRIVFIDSDAWAVADVCSHLCRRTEEIVGMGSPGTDVNSGVMSLRPSKARFDDMMNFWSQEPEKFFVYPKRGRLSNELCNPDQSLLIGYCNSRGITIGPLSLRYNLNGRHMKDSTTRIVHFNVDLVKPWTYSRDVVKRNSHEAEQRGDWKEKGVWDQILDWHQIEERVNLLYGGDAGK